MHDYNTGLDLKTFTVTTNFPIDGKPAGTNLAPSFQSLDQGVFQYKLKQPITSLKRQTITVSVKDNQGNITSLHRTFQVRRN
jgi:hypothetical protein